MKTFSKDSQAIAALLPEQYRVTQQSGTELPGSGEYLDNEEPGIYVDIVSGEPLFASSDKFDSGSGWPSFAKPIESDNIDEVRDTSHGMARTEVRSVHGNSHLGHVFQTGQVTVAVCDAALTQPRCGSSTATIWRRKGMALI